MSTDKVDNSEVDKIGAPKRQAAGDLHDREIASEYQVPRGSGTIGGDVLKPNAEQIGQEKSQSTSFRFQLQPKRQRLEDSDANGSKTETRDKIKIQTRGIVMNLAQKVQESNPVVPVKDESVKAAFGDSDDDNDAEEVPELVRIRMRNIGKYTPTSEGPRSYGKTKNGFTDSRLRHQPF